MWRGRGRRICEAAFSRLLEGDPGAAVGDVDGAAFLKAEFYDEMLHNEIILVGIDAQMRDFAFAVGDCFRKDPFFRAVSGYSVYRAVGGVGEPGAVFDAAVGFILPDDKGEYAVDRAGIPAEIEVSVLDIPQEKFLLGIAARPLAGVAGACHKVSGVPVDG